MDLGNPGFQTGAAVDCQGIHMRTANFSEAALYESTQHKMDVPALLSQHADQFGDALIVAGSCRVGNGVADDRDLSAGSSRGMSGGSGHICLGTARRRSHSAPPAWDHFNAFHFTARFVISENHAEVQRLCYY